MLLRGSSYRMRSMLLAGLLLAGSTVARSTAVAQPSAPARAQSNAPGLPAIDIRLAPGGVSSAIAVRNVLPPRPFDELLRNGFPARLHIRAETWTIGRWFDDIVSSVEWDVIMRYDLIDHTYEVARVTRDGISNLGTYATFADARSATELPFSAPVAQRARGEKGYVAVQGRRSPGTALSRGLRTLVSRILGGEVRHLESRTPVLRFD